MIDDGEIARRLSLAMLPHALVDCGEVVQHLVGLLDLFLKKRRTAGNRSFATQNVGMWSVVS